MKLDVFLFEKKCGSLFSTAKRGIVFEYDDEYLSDKNAKPLSASLPLFKKEFSQKECVPYFFGLLPEGEIKQKIASELHISELSTLKLLEALGGECAGTVSLFNAESEYSVPQKKYEFNLRNYQLIGENEIAERIRDCEKIPFMRSQKDYRLSLAGAQQKISLARFNGKWYIPKNGAPSTHIIKPARSDYPDISVNEYLSMKIAKEFLQNVPQVELLEFATGNDVFKVFCIERFDRIVSKKNDIVQIERIHQEDFCQALGIMSDKKYQNDGGPGIKEIISLLREKSSMPLMDIQNAAEYFIFQYFIGNCDAHGKNYSLLYKDGRRFAPAYDIVSTVVYPELSQNMSMKVASHYELEKIRKRHFVETFDECNVNSKVVNGIFEKFIDKANTIENILNDDTAANENFVLAEKIISRLKAVKNE